MLELPLAFYAFSGLINCIVSLTIAAIVLRKRPELPAARLFAYFAGLVGIWSWFYFLWLRTTEDAVLADFLERTCMMPVLLMPALFLHFATALTGRFRRPAIHIANYLIDIAFVLTTYTPAFSPGVGSYHVFPFWLIPGRVFPLHVLHMFACVGLGLLLIGLTAVRATGCFRWQLWWVFWGFCIGFLSGFTNYLAWYRLFPPILNPLVAFYVIAIGYGIVRHQLLDIRIIFRRGLVYSILIACITATYLVMVLLMERGFAGFFGYRSVLATVVVAFLVALFFNPLRDRIQTWVDRALFQATPAELAAQREQLLVEVRKGDQQKAVATLAAGLAHEIKNPLASIKTFTEHLSTKHTDPAFRAKFQKIVGGEVERINLIVQQLLEFAKPVPPKLAPVAVPQLLDETLELLNSEVLQRQVQVERTYTARHPILGDPQQLKQVFLNLLLNSLQAMNGHGTLEVATTSRDGALVVTIADNGAGIAPKDLPHIFEPFYSTKPTGTGLGLAVVQGIVKEHGGRIEVHSLLGEGTTMRLYLPAACGAERWQARRPC